MGSWQSKARNRLESTMEERDWEGEIPDDDIRFELLKRLPAKSLMRFKCVCRAWRTVIEDRTFAEQHHVQSKSQCDASYILLFLQVDRTYEESIIPVNYSAGNYSAVSTTHIVGQQFGKYSVCTDVVEGVACIRDMDMDINGTFSAMNVTTGEKLGLPPPAAKDYYFNNYFRPRYFLGFNPLTKNYKLLHFMLDEKSVRCEILTLGENSWREIGSFNDEPLNLRAEFKEIHGGVSVNGAVYWTRGPSVIIYFDVHMEKFMQLDLPNGVGMIFQLTRVADKLGLLCMGSEGTTVLWTLSSTKVWKMQEMPHLRNWIHEYEIIGTTRTGGFLWRSKVCSLVGASSRVPCMVQGISYTSYHPTSKSEGEIIIKINHPWVTSSRLRFLRATCDHVENILPLKTLC